jgi:uridine kinase
MPRDRPLRLGIDGRSAAGKTTIGDELASLLRSNGRQCFRASIDDFHPPGYKHRAMAGAFTPETYLREGYDYAAFRQLLLEPLGPGGTRRVRLNFWNSQDDLPFREDWVAFPEDAILIADGAFLLIPMLRFLWDFVIWMDVDWETMLERASSRDVAWVGSAALVRERYLTGWIPRHQWYEETLRPRELVDVEVDNKDIAHPRVIRARERWHDAVQS